MAIARTRSGRYAATVVRHGKQVWLGVFRTEQQARMACARWRGEHLDEWDAEKAETKSKIQLGFSRKWRHLSPKERERACHMRASRKRAR